MPKLKASKFFQNGTIEGAFLATACDARLTLDIWCFSYWHWTEFYLLYMEFFCLFVNFEQVLLKRLYYSLVGKSSSKLVSVLVL